MSSCGIRQRSETAAGASSFEDLRREPRETSLRIVEFIPVIRGSRTRSAHPLRVGFTRDISDSGMCLGLDEISSVGSLLHVTLKGLGGSPLRQAVGRVVWSRHDSDSRFWHGLELLGNGLGPLAGLC